MQSKWNTQHNKAFLPFIVLLFFIGHAHAVVVSETYGDGWRQLCFDDGKCAYSNHHPIQRWDGQYIPIKWLNINTGQWPYYYSENATYYDLYRLGERLSINKSFANYTFDLNKISLEFTVTPAQLASRSTLQVIGGVNYWYIVIPDKAAKTRFLWDNKLPIISNESGIILNKSEYDANGTLKWQNYKYQIVGDEIRLYYNQTARNFGLASSLITFKFDSWIVGIGGSAWSGNSTMNNISLNRASSKIELNDSVPDYAYRITFDNYTIIDEVTGNTGTWYGNTTANWTIGKYGTSLKFDGVNDYVLTAYYPSQYEKTMVYWGNWTSTGDYDASGVNDAANHRFYFGTSYGNIYGGLGANLISNGLSYISVNVWYSYAMRANSTYGIITNNNIERGSFAYTQTGVSTLPITIGAMNGATVGAFQNVAIDDYRIYNRTLSITELDNIINHNLSTTGNLTTWHDSGTGNEVYQIDINASGQTNANYSVFYRINGTGAWTLIGTPNSTANQSIELSPKYQNTDVKVELYGNKTTPEISTITFWTQVVPGGTSPNITSWSNNYTNNESLSLSATSPLTIQYNATANQSITNWYCVNSSYVSGNASTDGICEQYYDSTGTYYPSMYGSNANGSTLNSVNWTISISEVPPYPTNLSRSYTQNAKEYRRLNQ